MCHPYDSRNAKNDENSASAVTTVYFYSSFFYFLKMLSTSGPTVEGNTIYIITIITTRPQCTDSVCVKTRIIIL